MNNNLNFVKSMLFLSVLIIPINVRSWTLKANFDGNKGNESLFFNKRSKDYFFSGNYSIKFPLIQGQENTGQHVFQLGSTLYEGDELWIRVYVYPPPGFRWDANPITKLMRIAVANSIGEQIGYHSVLLTKQPNYDCGSSDTYGYMITGSEMNSSKKIPPICQNRNTKDGGAYLTAGQWHCVELYIKISSTNGIIRAWHNGILRNEYFYPTIPEGGYIPKIKTKNWTQSHLLGWWNGGPVKSQDIYFDSIIITNTTPNKQDTEKNYMIGME